MTQGPPEAVSVLSREDLSALSEVARLRPRLRANRNLHQMDDAVHRLLNAVEPGTYIRPHRHLEPPKSETVVVLSGKLGLLLFDGDGNLEGTDLLRPLPGRFLADIPEGVWHAFVSLSPGTVFFETKSGPYVAPTGGDLAPWAPAEGESGADILENGWRRMIQTIHADLTGSGKNPADSIQPG